VLDSDPAIGFKTSWLTNQACSAISVVPVTTLSLTRFKTSCPNRFSRGLDRRPRCEK